MFFSILVPTMGTRKDELQSFFESLSLQTYNDFEVVVVSQINHVDVSELVAIWGDRIKIKHVKLEKAGLSFARNQGLKVCVGDWIVLSDDDAWYPTDGLSNLFGVCSQNYQIVLTQIYDPMREKYYKDYGNKKKEITNKFQLMSKSSIEIAFKNELKNIGFDEHFGLGAEYVCGEEVDFLLNAYKKRKICYFPVISVYHQRKDGSASDKQQYAKGALYSKQFGRLTAWLISVRDTLKRRNVNKKAFWDGFNSYSLERYKISTIK